MLNACCSCSSWTGTPPSARSGIVQCYSASLALDSQKEDGSILPLSTISIDWVWGNDVCFCVGGRRYSLQTYTGQMCPMHYIMCSHWSLQSVVVTL